MIPVARSQCRTHGAFAVAVAMLASPALATSQVQVRTSLLFEAYELSSPFGGAIDRVDELSVPVTLSTALGDRVTLTVATGYARIVGWNGDERAMEIVGGLDTEARIGVELVPDRVIAFGTSAFPTGIGPVAEENLNALGVLTSEVIGFTSPNLGGGGSAGGGVAFTLPAGVMALGIAASYESSGTYQPFLAAGSTPPVEFRPGGELRLRLGIEGAVGRRTFLRASGILSRRGEDEQNGAPVPSVGNRYTGYVAADQGVGSSTFTVYAFDLYRAGRGVVETPAGPSVLNRGNVFAGGAQLTVPLAAGASLIPRVELRDSRSETDDEALGLVRQGRTTRFGADLRVRLSQSLAAVLRADGLSGSLLDTTGGDPTEIDVSGFRLAAQIEIGR